MVTKLGLEKFNTLLGWLFNLHHMPKDGPLQMSLSLNSIWNQMLTFCTCLCKFSQHSYCLATSSFVMSKTSAVLLQWSLTYWCCHPQLKPTFFAWWKNQELISQILGYPTVSIQSQELMRVKMVMLMLSRIMSCIISNVHSLSQICAVYLKQGH